ncbi:glycoside hydrolase domain-containing protein [Streptomyces sp. NPDC059153]|uniref:glycoside hydrolase domain-containing protein n=1 Tax=Streptomyces sp. NPDC059153 TaxID=3346743 RepID=UPI00369F923D
MGRDEEYKTLSERGGYWRNVFNPAATPTAGYIQARNADGSWVTPFNPASQLGFAQGSSTTYLWMVPQDVQGLATAMGGRDKTAARLDDFWAASAKSTTTVGVDEVLEVLGHDGTQACLDLRPGPRAALR